MSKFVSLVGLQALASDPVSGTEGYLYYNTTLDVVRCYTGASWISLPAVPTGGTTGQILAKSSGTDYDTSWVDNFTSDVRHLVKNDSGTTLAKGTAVYVSGANGTNILVKPALAYGEIESASVLGLLTQSLAANASGYVISEGMLSGLNTTGATAGDPVWLSGTTSGGLVYGLAAKPQAPYHLVYMGVVTRVNSNNGEIFVKVSNGWELDELHNVNISSPTQGQVLAYDASLQYWVNTAPTGGSGGVYDYTSLNGGDEASRVELAEITGGRIAETVDGGGVS